MRRGSVYSSVNTTHTTSYRTDSNTDCSANRARRIKHTPHVRYTITLTNTTDRRHVLLCDMTGLSILPHNERAAAQRQDSVVELVALSSHAVCT
jgi:hypothetical protein